MQLRCKQEDNRLSSCLSNNLNKNCRKSARYVKSSLAVSSCTDSQHSDTASDSAGPKSYNFIKSTYPLSNKQKYSSSTVSTVYAPNSDSSDSSSTQQCELSDTGVGFQKKVTNQAGPLLPTPSVERLLPIGSQRTAGNFTCLCLPLSALLHLFFISSQITCHSKPRSAEQTEIFRSSVIQERYDR